jgi:hypothetical protein
MERGLAAALSPHMGLAARAQKQATASPLMNALLPLDGNSRFGPNSDISGAEYCLAFSPSKPWSKPLSTLARVWYLSLPLAWSARRGGLHERLAIRHVDCVGGMAGEGSQQSVLMGVIVHALG